jgi:zinc transporter ZupT
MLVASSMIARLLIASVSLWAFQKISPAGFKPFAFALAGGFLVMYTVELVRYAGPNGHGRSLGTRQ